MRYTPEISAILRYDLDEPGGVRSTVYGKVQPGHRGLRTFRLEEKLWRAAVESDGLLRIPRPLVFVKELGILLEGEVPGEPVKGDRASKEFQGVGTAAAEAIAVIHETGMEPDERIHIETELDRLDSVAEQFIYVDPKAHFLLTELLLHIRDRLEKTYEEEILATHADLKYDQFMYDAGTYSPATTSRSSARTPFRPRQADGRTRSRRRRCGARSWAAIESSGLTRRSTDSRSTRR